MPNKFPALLAKIFIYTATALLLSLTATSPLHADDSPIFSWRKVLSEPAIGVDWSPDGQSIVFDDTDSNQIKLWNWQTRQIIWRASFPKSGDFGYIAFSARWSPDGQWIAATALGKLYLIDPQTGHFQLLEVSVPSDREQPDYVLARWGSDSSELAALDRNGFIDILSTATGQITQTIDLRGGVNWGDADYTAFDWSPDGQFFAAPIQWLGSMPSMGVAFWDQNGHLLEAYSQTSQTDKIPNTPCLRVYADGLVTGYDHVEWANDSRTILVAGYFGYGICRLNSDGTVYDHPIDDNGSSIFRWSPDQRWLVGAANAGAGLWFTDTANNYQTIVRQFVAVPNSFAWSPDSQHLALGTTRELWIGTLIVPA